MSWIRLIAEEFLCIWRDPRARVVLAGSIFLYAFFYPYPYSPELQTQVPVAVVDQDHTSLSRQLIRMVDAGNGARVTRRAASFDEAKALCLSGDVMSIVMVPEGFERTVLKGGKAEVALWSDATCFFTYSQVATSLLSSIHTLSAGIEIKRFRAGGMGEEEAVVALNSVPLQVVQLFNPSGGYASYVVPMVFALILQQTLIMGVGMVAGTRREEGDMSWFVREPGLWGATVMVSAKLAAYLLLYSIHALFYFGMLHRFYDFVHRGAALEMAFFMLLFLAPVILFALTLSVLFRHRETSIFLLLCTSLPVIFLTGISWPVESIPPWMRCLSLAIPSTAGIEGFLRISTMGATLAEVGWYVDILAGLTLVYFVTATLAFYKIGKPGMGRGEKPKNVPPMPKAS